MWQIQPLLVEPRLLYEFGTNDKDLCADSGSNIMDKLINFQQEGAVLTIQWDDGKANAVSPQLLVELNAALDQAERDQLIVILAGRPGRFSAGFDLQVMGQGDAAMAQLVVGGAKLALRLLSFPTPVIMACTGHGLAMGGLLLLSADYRIGVSGDYKIGLNEVAIGMTMPWFGVELARGRLAPAHFNRAVNNAEIYSSEGAVAAGFLDRVCDAQDLMADAMAVATGFEKLKMQAHHATKLRTRQQLLEAVSRGVELDFGKGVLQS